MSMKELITKPVEIVMMCKQFFFLHMQLKWQYYILLFLH